MPAFNNSLAQADRSFRTFGCGLPNVGMRRRDRASRSGGCCSATTCAEGHVWGMGNLDGRDIAVNYAKECGMRGCAYRFDGNELIEGSLEVKLPTIWTDEKQSRAEAERREKIRREKNRRERVRRKKMQMRENVKKLRNTMFFQWFEAPRVEK